MMFANVAGTICGIIGGGGPGGPPRRGGLWYGDCDADIWGEYISRSRCITGECDARGEWEGECACESGWGRN